MFRLMYVMLGNFELWRVTLARISKASTNGYTDVRRGCYRLRLTALGSATSKKLGRHHRMEDAAHAVEFSRLLVVRTTALAQ